MMEFSIPHYLKVKNKTLTPYAEIATGWKKAPEIALNIARLLLSVTKHNFIVFIAHLKNCSYKYCSNAEF